MVNLRTIDFLTFSALIVYCCVSAQNSCICVPFHQCDNGTIITDGTGIIDIRGGEFDETKNDCKSYLDICCNGTLTLKNPVIPKADKSCGKRNEDGTGFKITGNVDNESQFGELPWVAAIMKNAQYRCSGSLIHTEVILTAAHCVNVDTHQLTVRLGEWDSLTTKEIYPYQEREILSVIIHQDYTRYDQSNGIALVFLKSPVKLEPHINTVCLPPHNTIERSSRCLVAGWGKDVFGDRGRYQSIMKRIELPIVAKRQCQDDFRRTRLGSDFNLHESFVCAGGEEGKDACTGDGGGPLVCPITGKPGRYQQIGIVSWGIGCGKMDIPGAYVDVAYFRDWIDRQMRQKNFDISSYQL